MSYVKWWWKMIFPKSNFSPGLKHPYKNGMSHQHDNLTKPNRQLAHSVRGSGINNTHVFSSVRQSVTHSFQLSTLALSLIGPLSWRLSPSSVRSKSLTALQGQYTLTSTLPAAFPTHTTYFWWISCPSLYLILSCSILPLHTLNLHIIFLLSKFFVGWI